jgi:threonine/homoserine/homoserine lactone efflux protein
LVSESGAALISYILQGAALSFPAAIMPGPFQAYLLSQALKAGWKRTLPVAFVPLITDGPIIVLVLFLLSQTPQWFLDSLRIVGGLFILFLAKGILLTSGSEKTGVEPDQWTTRRTLRNAIVMNFLNPNPYIFWSVVAGPIMLSGCRESLGLGIGFTAGFYGMFVCTLMALIVVFAAAGRLNAKLNRGLTMLAGAALLGFGLYQIGIGTVAVMGLLHAG